MMDAERLTLNTVPSRHLSYQACSFLYPFVQYTSIFIRCTRTLLLVGHICNTIPDEVVMKLVGDGEEVAVDLAHRPALADHGFTEEYKSKYNSPQRFATKI
jgi:hypothetical protein